MKIRLLISIIALASYALVYPQITPGTISGSLVSNIHFYDNDKVLNLLAPQDRYASNTYLWLQYRNGPFTAGMQYEAYMPPLQGFPYQFEGNYISHRFLRFNKGFIDITAGNFYEQFGSGLSFRAYEERALGLNNSIDGLRLILTPAEWILLKGVYGKPRRFDEYADAYIRGVDGEIKVGKLLKTDHTINIGWGFLSKYQPYTGPDSGFPSTVNSYNTRVQADLGKISIYTEYVYKSDDPDAMNFFEDDPGNAFIFNASYASSGIGILLSSRYLYQMNFQAERGLTDGYSNINYLPSNSRQYTYMLSNLYPYSTQVNGEISFQADINYSVPAGTKIGGRYGMDFRFNYSVSGGIDMDSPINNLLSYMGENRYYTDLNFEVSKKWSKKFKANFAYQQIYYNKGIIEGGAENIVESDIIISDLQYRINRKLSVRTEIQHLWTADDHGNWFAMLGELNWSPSWSLYYSNMTDYQYTGRANYYNCGISYRNSYFRINLGYGRNREGYICSGGVCRKIPAYKGLNIGITSSF